MIFCPLLLRRRCAGVAGKKEPKKRQEKLRPNGGVGDEEKLFLCFFPRRARGEKRKCRRDDSACAEEGKGKWLGMRFALEAETFTP
jgi:hypothetical protein